MWDAEGNYYSFAAMPYTEAIEKGLVKKLVKKKENKIENVKQT